MLPHAEARDAEFLVREENWPSLLVFLSLQRRWDRGAWGGEFIALNTPAMESVMRMRRIPPRDRPAMFEDLLEMETAALPVMNRKK